MASESQSNSEAQVGGGAENGTDFGVGALLKACRHRCGEDLDEVSRMLRIRTTYLEAIEDGRYGDLPGMTYAIGFVRAYADHLGLDSAEVVRRFKEESSGIGQAAELHFPSPIPEGGVPGGAILLVGVLVAALAYGAWYVSTSEDQFFTRMISPIPDRLSNLLSDEELQTAGSNGTDKPQSAPSESAPAPAETTEASPPEQAATGDEKATGDDEPAIEESGSAPQPQQDTVPAATVTTELTDSPSGDGAAQGQDSNNDNQVAAEDPTTAEPTSDSGEEARADEATPAEAAEEPQPEVGSETASSEQPARENEDTAVPASGGSETAGDATVASTEAVDEPATPPGTEDAAAEAQTPAAETVSDDAPASEGPTEETAPQSAPETDAAAAPTAEEAGDTPQVAARTETPTSSRSEFQTPPGQAGAEGNSRITVRARTASWIQVRGGSGNELITTRLLRPGDTYAVPDRPGLRLFTGNAGALEILVDGEVVPPLGPVGAVRRDVELDAERLRAGTATGE